jgi:hypothetical protein
MLIYATVNTCTCCTAVYSYVAVLVCKYYQECMHRMYSNVRMPYVRISVYLRPLNKFASVNTSIF